MEEEQRLKALLTLEKASIDRKSERQAAEYAQRMRQAAKAQQRRSVYKDSLDSIVEEEAIALRLKNGYPSTPSRDFDLRIKKTNEGL